MQRSLLLPFRLLFTAACACTIAIPSAATCPPDPPPPTCDIDSQFPGGRWDISQITGSYTLSGSEVYWPFLDDEELSDDYTTNGTLDVQRMGGESENYLEVECDGTVTGQGRERLTGTISKTANIWYYNSDTCINQPSDMSWTVTIERTYSITGNVSGSGQLDLELSVDQATFDLDGSLAASFDCIFIRGSGTVSSFDVSGDTESVRFSGAPPTDGGSWQPTVTPNGSKTWVDDVLHRLKLSMEHEYQDDTLTLSPSLTGGSGGQPARQEYLEYLIQDAVTVSENLQATAEPKTPVITSMELQEPSRYLSDVDVDTEVRVSIDWRSASPGQVEFTYGSTTETVAGADEVTWTFDAGESGTTIEAKAIAGSEESEPYTINTPKVSLPSWAGSSSDWSGSSGVQYDGMLDWPVSLETTQTLNTIELFTGLWGISGGASSDFQAQANSNGSPGSGEMTTEADIQFAGNSASFRMEGPNTTTLECDQLTTTGSATAQVDGPTWQKTLNPITVVPGIEAGACGLSGLLCGVVRSVGVKASASVTLDGTATYTGEAGDIEWDGGSLGGSITGEISAGATLPPPIASAAGVRVWGSATGCLEFQVAPSLELTTVGGELEAGASATFMGLSTEATETWPFGSGCSRRAATRTGAESGWVPGDGQLAMAVDLIDGELFGAAVWSELPDGQARPSGDIHYRIVRGGTWGPIRSLTADAASDVAPTVAIDADGDLLIVHQRSTASLPTSVADLPTFANSYELHWARVSSTSELPTATGVLTDDALHDVGPRWRRGASGDLHLFWQRVDGVELAGTASAPASIHVASWQADDGSWTSDTVASGLTGTFGWSPAVFDPATMLVGLIVDTDGDFETADDREVFEISRQAGVWLAPRRSTTDTTTDDAVLATFTADGEPSLLWRRGRETVEVVGDLAAVPTVAFTTPDPTRDAGISAELAHGVALSTMAEDVVLWPEAGELLWTRRGATDPAWGDPGTLIPEDGAQSVHAVRPVGGELLIGWATRTAGVDPAAALLEPRVLRQPSADGVLFADGFETGGLSAWTEGR